MSWQWNPYVWTLLVAALTTASLVVYALSRRSVPGARLFALFASSLIFWSLGYALELVSTTLPAQMLWLNLRYVGIDMVSPTWLFFSLRYTGHDRWLTRRNVAAIAAVSATLWLFEVTNAAHGLYWRNVHMETIDGLLKWKADAYGPLYWANLVWAYILLTAGNLLVLQALVRSPRLHRGQAVCVMATVVGPWLANGLYQFGWEPFGIYDPTPPAFTLSVIFMAWALFRYGFLELLPVARHLVVEGMSDAVIVLDPADRVLDLNPAARRLLGFGGTNAIGCTFAEVFPDVPRVREDGALGRRGPEVSRMVDGTARAYEVRESPLVAGGTSRGRLVMLADITERKRAEEAIARQNQHLQALNHMKTNFMIVTSHEMRTPITVLLGYHEALSDAKLGDVGTKERALQVCRRTVERMAVGIEDILEMLRLDEGRLRLERRPADLVALAREVGDELAPFVVRRKQRLSVEAEGEVMAEVDVAKMRLVLHNLIENAIKFTPDGGAIRVELRADDGEVHATVSDDGIGIAGAELERIFERFYTGADALHHRSGRFEFEARGAGLGLSIVRGHVEAHGGRAWAESPGTGRGSRFHVTVPREAVSAATGAA